MPRSIWVLHSSRDGRFWKLEQPPRIYINQHHAEHRAEQNNRQYARTKFKAVEYRPVEANQ